MKQGGLGEDLVQKLRRDDPDSSNGSQERKKSVLFSFVDRKTGHSVSVFLGEDKKVRAMVFDAGTDMNARPTDTLSIPVHHLHEVISETGSRFALEKLKSYAFDDALARGKGLSQEEQKSLFEAEQDIAEGMEVASSLSEREIDQIGLQVAEPDLKRLEDEIGRKIDTLQSDERKLLELEQKSIEKEGFLQKIFPRLSRIENVEQEKEKLRQKIEKDKEALIRLQQEREEKGIQLKELRSKVNTVDLVERRNFEAKRTTDLFRKEFGISEEELATIPGFHELSDGKKRLVFENLRYATLGRMEENARKQALAEDAAEGGFFRRVWRSASKFLGHENVRLERGRDVSFEAFRNGGLALHGEQLRKMIDMTTRGPEASFGRDGKLNVYFFTLGYESLPEGSRQDVLEFNKVARALSEIPYEWSFPNANTKDRNRYESAKHAYVHARSELLKQLPHLVAHKKETHLSAQNILIAVNEADAQVELQRFLSRDSEIERRFKNARDPSLWKRISKRVFGEQTAYFAGGTAARAIFTETLGWLGAPAAAGAVFQGIRTNEQLKKEAIDTRYGNVKSEKEMKKYEKNFVPIEKLLQKLEEERLIVEMETLSEVGDADKKKKVLKKALARGIQAKRTLEQEKTKADSPESVEKLSLGSPLLREKLQMEALERLQARVKYTRKKLEEGLVSFGSADDRFMNQLTLLQELSRAEMLVAGNGIAHNALAERMKSFLDVRERRIARRKKWYIAGKMAIGSGIAAGFSLAGALVRDGAAELLGDRIRFNFGKIEDYLRSLDDAVVSIQSSLGLNQGYTPPTTREVSGFIAPPISEAAQTVDGASYAYEVSSGGSVWKGVKGMILSDPRFEGITVGELNTLVENITSRLAELPKETLVEEYGLSSGNLSKVRPGETLHLGRVFEDFPEIFESALAKRAGS